MEILDPIPLTDVLAGRGRGRVSPHESLFQQALQLDGLALPVQCEEAYIARSLAHSCQARLGRGTVLGIRAVQRGLTVFLYRGDDKKA